MTVVVEVPAKLTKAQKAELENLDETLDVKQYDKLKTYKANLSALYGEK